MMILPRNSMYLWYFISKSGYFGSITAHNAWGYDGFCLYGAFIVIYDHLEPFEIQ